MTQSEGRDSGWTLIELAAVLALIGLLAAVAFASFTGASGHAEAVVCADNRTTLETILVVYEQEEGVPPTSITDLKPYIRHFDNAITCPSTGVKLTYDAVNQKIACPEHSP
jgi:prepilin-type N-terminal cleavage/methylation domain-containing protein